MWTLWSHKLRRISWTADKPVGFSTTLCTGVLVNWFVTLLGATWKWLHYSRPRSVGKCAAVDTEDSYANVYLNGLSKTTKTLLTLFWQFYKQLHPEIQFRVYNNPPLTNMNADDRLVQCEAADFAGKMYSRQLHLQVWTYPTISSFFQKWQFKPE